MTTKLTCLKAMDCAELEAALTNQGYLDNKLATAKFGDMYQSRRGGPVWWYDVTYDLGGGEMEAGKVFVSVSPLTGEIVADW